MFYFKNYSIKNKLITIILLVSTIASIAGYLLILNNDIDILRDNMPFGSAGAGEYGTYFIGYSGKLWVTEKMLERMFIGAPEGLYDRLLDFSEAKTGTTFFAPCRGVLEEISGG